jgi:hypothetical protein
MPPGTIPTTTTITVFTRHSPNCAKKGDRRWKRCKCRKCPHNYENAGLNYKPSRTGSWVKAKLIAEEERKARDFAGIKLGWIADRSRPAKRNRKRTYRGESEVRDSNSELGRLVRSSRLPFSANSRTIRLWPRTCASMPFLRSHKCGIR